MKSTTRTVVDEIANAHAENSYIYQLEDCLGAILLGLSRGCSPIHEQLFSACASACEAYGISTEPIMKRAIAILDQEDDDYRYGSL